MQFTDKCNVLYGHCCRWLMLVLSVVVCPTLTPIKYHCITAMLGTFITVEAYSTTILGQITDTCMC